MLTRLPRTLRNVAGEAPTSSRSPKRMLPVTRPAGCSVQTEDRQAGDALAAAGFTNQAHDFTWLNVEAQIVDRAHGAFARGESHRQVANTQQRFCVVRHVLPLGSSASRKPSPRKLRLISVTPKNELGQSKIHQ